MASLARTGLRAKTVSSPSSYTFSAIVPSKAQLRHGLCRWAEDVPLYLLAPARRET